ncbi:MAG: DegT/DnrJ/EryC1/StrS family aminotransferase [Desulfurococcales archaeon]|nr:DegT/DnrJ/EryC1/StrS family aminotransferase [Desulfurococcales archaeon]
MRLRIPISKPLLGKEEEEAVRKVMASGILAHGPEVEKFEEEFASYLGVKHVVAVANGTVALDVALKAIGIKNGDEVITTPFTFIATANSILYQGARPVFADINPETYTIDPDKVLELVNSKTRAIIVVHLYGHPVDMDPIREIAEDYNLLVVEDAAQAHGSMYKGKKVGSLGDVGAFSFYPTKNMTTGEGGAVVTDNDEIARKARLVRNHGQERKYYHTVLGYNYRMTSIGAAIGRVQLKKLDKMNEIRRRNATLLSQFTKYIQGIEPPVEKEWAHHVYHQYVIRVKGDCRYDRDSLKKLLEKRGIGTGIHYPLTIPEQPLYKKLGIGCEKTCENALKASREILSLPVHPLVSKEDIDYIGKVLGELCG